jgi:hypothetical protein
MYVEQGMFFTEVVHLVAHGQSQLFFEQYQCQNGILLECLIDRDYMQIIAYFHHWVLPARPNGPAEPTLYPN